MGHRDRDTKSEGERSGHRGETSEREHHRKRRYEDDEERSRKKEKKHRDRDRETSTEREARKAAKAEAKAATKRAEEASRAAAAELSYYSATDNPFHDANLGQKFVWTKKQEKEKKSGITMEEAQRRESQRRVEAKDELERLNRRRAEREREAELREAEESRMQRMAESARMDEWLAGEDDFRLSQAKKRAEIRVRERRAKPIDYLALNLKWSVPPVTVTGKEEEDEGEGLDFDLEEPYTIFENLTLEETEELQEDINMYLSLEKNEHNLDFWRSMLLVCASVLEDLRERRRLGHAQYAEQSRHSAAIKREISEMLAGKSFDELAALQLQVQKKLASNEPIDVEYWENLLKELIVWKAKSKLRDMHEIVLRNRLEQLRRRQRDEAINAQRELELSVGRTPASTDEGRPEPYRKEMSPMLITELSAEDKTLDMIMEADDIKALIAARRAVAQKRFVSKKVRDTGEAHPDNDQVAEAMFKAEVDKGFDSDEEVFEQVEEDLSEQTYLWEDKYRPRKPRYYNKVLTGYEWNKYNQTHYDLDNPPPKVVQGYKMTIFLPDLIDKTKAPTFNITKEPGNDDTCLLVFKCGPPYEDLAFRIVNREWEYSHKKGFRCSFDRGVLQLWIQFKRIAYRK